MTLRDRIARARKRVAKVPPGSPGWAEALVLVHEADRALKRAEDSIAKAEVLLDGDPT